jgi:hypothetical protein
MTQEFVPYELAVKLKKLGFDEPCFGYYNYNGSHFFKFKPRTDDKNLTKAPLYQQAFRWFREKYNLHPIVSFDKFIDEDDNDVELDEPYFTYYYSINELWDNTKDYNKFVRGFVNVSSSRGIMSQEEAELACLEKLIEIVESKL